MVPTAPFDVFFDESGQTGMDFLSRDQPFYVLAGWMVPRSRRADLSKRVSDKAGQILSRRELKGSRLLKTPGGRTEAASVIEEMLDSGCLPTFSLVEKRYAIAAKIVETFIDPPVNDLVGMDITWDPLRRQRLADHIYSFTNATLRLGWQAIRHPTIAYLRSALEALVAEGQASKNTDIASLLSGAKPHLAEIYDLLQTGYEDPAWRQAQALPLPSISGLLDKIDRLGEAAGFTDVSIYHDETSIFGPLIERVFALMRDVAPPHDFEMLDGTVMRVGLGAIHQFSLTNSVAEPLIQAADIVASAMIAWAQRRLRQDPKDNIVTAIVDDLIAPFGVLPDPSPGMLLASSEFIQRMITHRVPPRDS